jgi:hypothetical protein
VSAVVAVDTAEFGTDAAASETIGSMVKHILDDNQ